MKVCAYCGRENADHAARCRECDTAELKSDPPTEPEEELNITNQESPDVFQDIWSFPPWDARRVMDAFVQAEVRYTLHPGGGGGDTLSEFGASYGPVSIEVHVDDLEEALRIQNRVLNIQV